MKTLDKLLAKYRQSFVSVQFGTPGANDKLLAARDAIADHVENAMIEALMMGKRVGSSDGVGPFCTQARQDKWDELVKKWTMPDGGAK